MRAAPVVVTWSLRGRYVVVTGHGDMLREMFTVFSGIVFFLGFSAFISYFKTLVCPFEMDDSG